MVQRLSTEQTAGREGSRSIALQSKWRWEEALPEWPEESGLLPFFSSEGASWLWAGVVEPIAFCWWLLGGIFVTGDLVLWLRSTTVLQTGSWLGFRHGVDLEVVLVSCAFPVFALCVDALFLDGLEKQKTFWLEFWLFQDQGSVIKEALSLNSLLRNAVEANEHLYERRGRLEGTLEITGHTGFQIIF